MILYKEKDFPLRPTASKTSLNIFITPAADFEEDMAAAEIAAADDEETLQLFLKKSGQIGINKSSSLAPSESNLMNMISLTPPPF